MSDAPLLSPESLVEELRHIHRKNHRTANTVLLARMSPELPSVELSDARGRRTFRVATARSELELRAALSDDSAGADPVVVLVDWDPGRLPADLGGRVATGMVQTIARSRRIRASFGQAQVSDELLACRSLVDAIVNDPQFRRAPPPGGLVTLDAGWRAFLVARRVFGQESETEATLLARWAREPVPAGLAAFLQQRDELKSRLEAWLDAAVGQVARWGLRLWLAEKGSTAASLAFVLDATRASFGARDYVEGVLSMKLEELTTPLGRERLSDLPLLERWANLASMVAAQLDDDAATLLKVVDSADRLLPAHPLVGEALERSDYLRTALESRKRALAEALDRAAEEPSDEPARVVQASLEALAKHRLRDVDRGQRELFERARMAARLTGWLAVRAKDVAFGATTSDVVVLEERAEDFVRHGAFADFARRGARGSTADALGQAIQRVVERADALRDRDDAEFSRGLLAWNELGRTAHRVLPIESGLDRFAARFLQEDRARRLLIVLLDGMSWANAVELLESLEAAHYAPLRWKVPGFDRAGLPPVIAALPTITDVSRAALFAGQLLRPGDALDSSRDPVRLEHHKALRELGEKPQLLLKAQLQSASGDASPEALDLVGSPKRVVAVVINAIDDQLKAGRQTRVAYSLETIKPLRDLLDRATMADRAVLLVSDHGHVSGARLTRTAQRASEDPGGSRWRALRSDGAIADHERVTAGSYAWRPAGFDRLALLVRETDSYGYATSEGEHGGATMAEAIAPAVLVASESLAERSKNATEREKVDPDLEVRPLARPLWWDLRAPSKRAQPQQTVSAPSAERHHTPPVTPLLPMSGLGPTEPTKGAAASRGALSPWELFFARSKVLKELDRKLDPRFVRAIAALDAEGGVLSADRLAQAIEILPARVEGIVAKMAEVFNADGTQVVQYESGSRLVRVDLAALREIFG
jgi:hypothetical protein